MTTGSTGDPDSAFSGGLITSVGEFFFKDDVIRSIELKRLARAMYNQLRGLVEVPICFLGLFDESLQTVHVVWQVHEGVELPGGSFPVGSGFTSRVIRTRQPLLIRRWSGGGPRVQLEYATDKPGLPESSCTVPLLFYGRVLGVVSIQSYRPEAFNEQHLTVLQAVVNQAGVKLARVAVEWLVSARRDPDADTTLASVSHAVLVLDKHGKIVHVNSAARLLLCGADASIVLGEPLDRIAGHQCSHAHPELVDKLRPVVALLKKGSVPPVVEVEAGADQRTFLVKAQPMLSQSGAVLGGVIVLRDQSGDTHPRCSPSDQRQGA